MQQFLRNGRTYWGGLHRELGLLIYDPRAQQHLAADKVRLYVVAERRLATFVKDLVRAGLVPSRLETWWCAQHAVVMQPWHNALGTWYNHQIADGTSCTGQATTTDADTPARPHTTHNQGGPDASLSHPRTAPGHDESRRLGQRPLAPYFAQVVAPSTEEAAACLLGSAMAPQARATVAALEAQRVDRATLPATVVAHRTRKQQVATPQAWLQRWAPQRLDGTEETCHCRTTTRSHAGTTRPGPGREIAHPRPMAVHRMPTPPIATPSGLITDRILTLLAQGTVPWQQPLERTRGMPRNLGSQRPWRGINMRREKGPEPLPTGKDLMRPAKVRATSALVVLDVAIHTTTPADRALASADGILSSAGHMITVPASPLGGSEQPTMALQTRRSAARAGGDSMTTTPQLMTPEAYVQQPGGCCPACRSGQIVGNCFDAEAAQVWQRLRCLACGASWTDVYRLQGYEDLALPDGLPQEEQVRLLREVLRNRDLNPHDVLELADGVEAALLALPAIQEHIRAAWREEHALASEEAAEREENDHE